MRRLRFLQAILTLMVAFAFAGMGKVTAYAAGSDVYFIIGDDGNQRKDLSDVNGLSWDASSSTLTMDGYEGGAISIFSDNGLQEVKVLVKGENTIAFNGSIGFGLKNIKANFVGTGSLNIKILAEEHSGHVGMGWYIVDENVSEVEINGPTINFVNTDSQGFMTAMYVHKLELKSGKLYFEMSEIFTPIGTVAQNSPIMILSETYISGGTIVVKYLDGAEATDVFPVIYSRVNDDKVIGYIDNCVIVISGKENITSRVDMAGCWTRGRVEGYEVKKGDNIIFEKTDLLYYFKGVNISKFKATLSQKTYNYDGKAKTPKVKVGNLIEGNDYTVKYVNNINPGTATAIVTGKDIYTGEIKLNFTIVGGDKQKIGKIFNKGEVFSDGLYKYKVIKSPSRDGKVAGKVKLIRLVNKKIHILVIPGAIRKNDVRYKVVKIGNKAFKGNKKLKKVDIDHHIEKIGKQAFYNCKSLTEVNIFTKDLKTIGKQAFFRKKGKKLIIRVPKGLKKKYKKMLKKAKTNKYVVKKYVPITKK